MQVALTNLVKPIRQREGGGGGDGPGPKAAVGDRAAEIYRLEAPPRRHILDHVVGGQRASHGLQTMVWRRNRRALRVRDRTEYFVVASRGSTGAVYNSIYGRSKYQTIDYIDYSILIVHASRIQLYTVAVTHLAVLLSVGSDLRFAP